jgi:hypothetical protein
MDGEQDYEEQNYNDRVIVYLQSLNGLQEGLSSAKPKAVKTAAINVLYGNWVDRFYEEYNAIRLHGDPPFDRSSGINLIELFRKKLDSGQLKELIVEALERANISPVPPENVKAIVEAIELELDL